MAKQKIKDRIITAIREHGEYGFIEYHTLATHVFPVEDYPHAWNYPTRGGPPGCYMPLSRALRVHEFYIKFQNDKPVAHALVGLGKNKGGNA